MKQKTYVSLVANDVGWDEFQDDVNDDIKSAMLDEYEVQDIKFSTTLIDKDTVEYAVIILYKLIELH